MKSIMCASLDQLTLENRCRPSWRQTYWCIFRTWWKNPMIVCADANLETFLEVAVRGCFTSAGQLCVSIERMYIHESIYEKFLTAFVQKVKELKLGAQLGWGYDVGSLVTDALVNRVSDAVSTAVAQAQKSKPAESFELKLDQTYMSQQFSLV
jgi:acyl-CoA reductase-like NAD-dependent aldehyde dehydrogenase